MINKSNLFSLESILEKLNSHKKLNQQTKTYDSDISWQLVRKLGVPFNQPNSFFKL